MSQARDTSGAPRAIIHKQILDVAASRPRASMEEIADDVAGASLSLVEKVLEQYGDPADATAEPSSEQRSADPDTDPATADPEPMSDDGSTPDTTAAADDHDSPTLTESQHRALQFITDHPDASQSALAEEFDVTRATISRWVNAIPGFEWDDRAAIAADLLDHEEPAGPSENGSTAATASSDPDSIDRLRDRVAAVEQQLEAPVAAAAGLDPELLHKVVHACMRSEHISEAEELELIRTLIGADRPE